MLIRLSYLDSQEHVGREIITHVLISINCGGLQQEIPCEYEYFDKIVHSVESWKGDHGCINFNLKEKALKYFLKHKAKYCCQLANNNFPFDLFCLLHSKGHIIS